MSDSPPGGIGGLPRIVSALLAVAISLVIFFGVLCGSLAVVGPGPDSASSIARGGIALFFALLLSIGFLVYTIFAWK